MHRGSFGFYTEFDLGLELDSGKLTFRASTRRGKERRDGVLILPLALFSLFFLRFADAAEVRGVLLVGDEEWGRVTFDFLQ